MKILTFILLSTLFSCGQKSQVKPLFQAVKLAQSNGDGRYTVVKIKLPLSEKTVSAYESRTDPRRIVVPVLGDLMNRFTGTFLTLGASLGLGKTLMTLHQPVPDLSSPMLKSVVVKRVFFHIDNENALEKNNIRQGIAYYWRKMREFIQVEESTDFSFIRDLRLRVEGVQREVVVNDYVPEDPEIKDMLSKETSLKWKRNIKNKKELVSYVRKNQEESLTKNRQRYIFYTDKPVALKNLLTLDSDFKNIVHDVTVINKTLMVELKGNEITEEKFYFLLDKVENVFLEYEISKINKCTPMTCLDFAISEENLLDVVKNKNFLKIEAYVDASKQPPASFQLKGYIEFEVKLDLPL